MLIFHNYLVFNVIQLGLGFFLVPAGGTCLKLLL